MQTGQRRLLVIWLAMAFGHEAARRPVNGNQSHHGRDGIIIGNGRQSQEMADDGTRREVGAA
jgi:hypothetical protein